MKPSNIFIVRHGQSEGNVDKTIYERQPDYTLNLTEKGVKQALNAGEEIYNLCSNSKAAMFYISPFYRARQTAHHIKKAFHSMEIKSIEDVRLREQEWGQHIAGSFNEDYEVQRDQHGHFYWRFPHGESCADVYDRISTFLSTLHRDFEKPDFPHNVIIVTHGMTMRVLLMRWFHMSVEEFELLANPKNAAFYHLTLDRVSGKFSLANKVQKYKQWKHDYVYKAE